MATKKKKVRNTHHSYRPRQKLYPGSVFDLSVACSARSRYGPASSKVPVRRITSTNLAKAGKYAGRRSEDISYCAVCEVPKNVIKIIKVKLAKIHKGLYIPVNNLLLIKK